MANAGKNAKKKRAKASLRILTTCSETIAEKSSSSKDIRIYLDFRISITLSSRSPFILLRLQFLNASCIPIDEALIDRCDVRDRTGNF